MKLSVSMYSCVLAVRAGQLDLMGFIDYAATQAVAGLELLDIFWTDAEREIPQVKARIADAGLEVAVPIVITPPSLIRISAFRITTLVLAMNGPFSMALVHSAMSLALSKFSL